MKHVKTEMLVTIELSLEELNYIVACMNIVDDIKVHEDLDRNSLCYDEDKYDELFDELYDLSGYEKN